MPARRVSTATVAPSASAAATRCGSGSVATSDRPRPRAAAAGRAADRAGRSRRRPPSCPARTRPRSSACSATPSGSSSVASASGASRAADGRGVPATPAASGARRRSSCPANRQARQRFSSPARHGAQPPHGIAGSSATRSPVARPRLDHADELVTEDERPRQDDVADPALAEPVQVGAAQADGGDAHEHLVRRPAPAPAPRAAAGRPCRGGAARSSGLAVVGVRPVLAREVPLEQGVVERRRLGLRARACQSASSRHRLERDRVLDRLARRRHPRRTARAMPTRTAGISSGSSPRLVERLDDHVAGSLPRSRRGSRPLSARA